MRRLLSCVLLICLSARGQDASRGEQVTFSFERHGVAVPQWGIEVYADGKGRYWEPVAATEANPAGKRWRDLEVGKATWDRIVAGQARIKAGFCETRMKNIAQTGRKELTYRLGPALTSCVFNYSDDSRVMDAAAAFQAMAETIQVGARLERERRYDRLGLDADMFSLADELKSGSAIELENIAPTLRAISGDSELMSRVRALASKWLAEMPSAAGQ